MIKIIFDWMLSDSGKKYLLLSAGLWVFAIYPIFVCANNNVCTWPTYVSASFIAFLYLLSGILFWVLLYYISKAADKGKL